MPTGGVRLDGGPVLSENETSVLGSDVSSIISISDYVADTTDDDLATNAHDFHKYRMPDIGKTRLNRRTKEPLSPSPLPVMDSPVRKSRPSVPSTPRTETNGVLGSPGQTFSPSFFFRRNPSIDGSIDGEIRPGLPRAGSVYTLGRASFTGQLSQLTSIRLPDAETLTKHITSIPTAREAAIALTDASDQIRTWIAKASEVLNGLTAEDDVEWAAAGGREGIAEVDLAIQRFEKLVDVYILSIERLQSRGDIKELTSSELNGSVQQMESIISSWQKIKDTLRSVKEQVEIAMEWERLWNTVLGEAAQELEALNNLVFEMEEKRHNGAESLLSTRDTIDLNDLETLIDDRPGGRDLANGQRLSINLMPPSLQLSSPTENENDGTLLALFARMQPLRAALDFLPMRLATFDIRGRSIFPTASSDLVQRREQLEIMWTKLKSDADSLRGELGEDRWITVFRNAGRQALKMCESITRSVGKLQDGLDAGELQSNFAALNRKAESYEAKKLHYGPAIERVLAIIDRGVADRLTLNGEVLRLQDEMRRRWRSLQAELEALDTVLEEVHQVRDTQLRDSISTVVSSERSINSSHFGTPGSSPASSIVGLSRKGSFQRASTPTPGIGQKMWRDRSRHSSGSSTQPSGHALPQSAIPIRTAIPRKTPQTLLSPLDAQFPTTVTPSRPRWNTSTRLEYRSDFLPLSALEPSIHAKQPATPKANYLRASQTPSSAPPSKRRDFSTPLPSRMSVGPATLPQARNSSLPVPRQAVSAAQNTPVPSRFRPASRLSSGRRSSLATERPVDGHEADNESPTHHKRPPSALCVARKRSSLFQPRTQASTVAVAVAVAASSSATASHLPEKPRWRG